MADTFIDSGLSAGDDPVDLTTHRAKESVGFGIRAGIMSGALLNAIEHEGSEDVARYVAIVSASNLENLVDNTDPTLRRQVATQLWKLHISRRAVDGEALSAATLNSLDRLARAYVTDAFLSQFDSAESALVANLIEHTSEKLRNDPYYIKLNKFRQGRDCSDITEAHSMLFVAHQSTDENDRAFAKAVLESLDDRTREDLFCDKQKVYAVVLSDADMFVDFNLAVEKRFIGEVFDILRKADRSFVDAPLIPNYIRDTQFHFFAFLVINIAELRAKYVDVAMQTESPATTNAGSAIEGPVSSHAERESFVGWVFNQATFRHLISPALFMTIQDRPDSAIGTTAKELLVRAGYTRGHGPLSDGEAGGVFDWQAIYMNAFLDHSSQ